MRIGVASTDRREEEDWIMEELAERGHDAVFIHPPDVSYLVKDGDLHMWYEGRELHNFDEVLFVRRSRHDVQSVRDLVAAMEKIGARTIERRDVFFNPLSKFYSAIQFVGETVHNVHIPATGIVRDTAEVERIASNVGFPLIMKPIAGREGEGVQKIDTETDLRNVTASEEPPFLLQQYLDIEEEYRVLVVGDEALGTVVKEPAEDADDAVARNFAQGATFAAVERPELEKAAVEIANILGIEVAGVDIVETVDGEYYEIECNRCPQFKGFSEAHPDVDVAAKIVDYIEEQAG